MLGRPAKDATNRKRLIIIGLASLALAGCGGSSSFGSTGTTSTPTPSPGTVTDTGSSIGAGSGATAQSAPPAQPTLTKAKACRDFRNFIDSGLSGTVQAQDIGIHTFQAACPAQANADGFGASYGTATQCASLDQHGCTAWHDPTLPVNADAATIEADAHGS